MSVWRMLSEYRWPIFIGGLLAMSISASAVIVYVATRPDAPRPIRGYYEAAQAWDADEAVVDASRQLGWSVAYALPADVPYVAGMPRPVDVTVTDRSNQPVTGLTGRLFAMRPSDARLNQTATLTALPQTPGRYRTLVRMDAPGAWEVRIDTTQGSLRFVHVARLTLPDDQGGASR